MAAYAACTILAALLQISAAQNFVTTSTEHVDFSPTVRDDVYLRCPRGSVYNGLALDTVQTRSTLDCAARCLMKEECEGVNVCPDPDSSAALVCTLIGDRSPTGCLGLAGASSYRCFFMQRNHNDDYTTSSTLSPTITTTTTSAEGNNNAADTTSNAVGTPAENTATAASTTVETARTTTAADTIIPADSSADTITTAGSAPTATASQDTGTGAGATPTSGSISTATTFPAASTSTGIVCQNGGTVTGNAQCICPIPYAGTTCERYMMDCMEADPSYYYFDDWSIAPYIQPTTSPQPFQVQCYQQNTLVLRRQTQQLFDMSWEEAKTGFGNVTSPDFFIGLANLHHLTSQAEYDLHISLRSFMPSSLSFTVTYSRFEIKDESSSYDLSYSAFSTDMMGGMYEAQDAFGGSSLDFCTWDRDCHGCASSYGKPGWYHSDCQGYSPFEEFLTWPAGFMETAISTDTVIFLLEKKYAYHW